MKNVLLVTRDTGVVNLVAANALKLNIKVRLLESADDILTHLRKSKPDLLLIDFLLNDINGGGLCHQIKCDTTLHYLPVILLSDYPNMESLSAKFGCNAMLTKPIDVNALTEVLQELSMEPSFR